MFDGKREARVKVSKASWKKAMRIFAYIRPYRIRFSIGIIFLFLSTMSSMLFPALLGKLMSIGMGSSSEPTPEILDTGTSTQLDWLELSTMNEVLILLAIVLISQAVFSFFRIYLFAGVTERMLAKLRQSTYEHLIKLPMAFFDKKRVGELNSRIASDISLLQETFMTTLAEFLRQMIIIVTGTAFLIFISYKLTLMMFVTFPVMIVAAVFFGRFIKKLSKETQQSIADSQIIVEETFSGIANVKSFVNEFFEVVRYRKVTEEVRDIAMKGATWRGAFAAFIILGIFGSITFVIWQGVLLVESGVIGPGELVSFLIYCVFVGASLGGSADLFAKIQKSVGATENLMDLLEEKHEDIVVAPATPDTLVSKGDLAFTNVSFEYPSRLDKTVLNDVSFSVKSGERVAIVGPSGAGKSTVVSLLLRFYDPTKGHISLDGKDINNYPLADLRRQMAVVPQDILLFGGTIRENIAYGNPNATEEAIVKAAEQANAAEFVNSFSEGYDTLVGERGVQLSGGQRQRIAIARAILKDPKILLLDEATSSLDSESEKLVQEALDKLMVGRTSVVIAHRLATIRKANRILVLEDGTIRESGTHEELLALENGLYKSLSTLQFDPT